MKQKPSNKRAVLRYEKIIDAGLDVFLQKGYDATSLNDIIAICGGSLSTVYKYFENKEGLFKAILENGVKYFNAQMNKKIKIEQNLSIEEYLENFAKIYMNVIFAPRSIMFQRLVAFEGFRYDTNIGKMFIDYGVTQINQILVEYFKKNIEILDAELTQCESLARYFRLLIREPYLFNAVVLNQEFNLVEEQKNEHIQKSIKLFLNGCLKR